MKHAVLGLADRLHRLVTGTCLILLAVLFALECAVVLLRYGFGIGFLELQDLARYCFASLVLLALPVALVADEHVRVDVWRERQSVRSQRRCDVLGILLLSTPAFLLIIVWSLPELMFAWSIREGSRETGGLGGVYLVKTVLPLSCALMVLQGTARLLRGNAT